MCSQCTPRSSCDCLWLRDPHATRLCANSAAAVSGTTACGTRVANAKAGHTDLFLADVQHHAARLWSSLSSSASEPYRQLKIRLHCVPRPMLAVRSWIKARLFSQQCKNDKRSAHYTKQSRLKLCKSQAACTDLWPLQCQSQGLHARSLGPRSRLGGGSRSACLFW